MSKYVIFFHNILAYKFVNIDIEILVTLKMFTESFKKSI